MAFAYKLALYVAAVSSTSPNPYRPPKNDVPPVLRTRRFLKLSAWIVTLFVPTIAQLVLLQTQVFRIEFAPLLFGACCFIYVMVWRYCCRSAYHHDERENADILARHPMVVRMSVLALVGVLVSAALMLGLSLVTETGPNDYPAMWLLLAVLFLGYKELIVACAITITRTADDAYHG